MSLPKKKDGVNGLIAVAVNNEKESHRAFKWAIDNLLTRNANVILIHVKILPPDAEINANDNDDDSLLICKEPDADALYMFLPYCVFCTRKYIQCKRVLLEDADVSKALIEYASQVGIEHLILGSSAKTSLHKIFKATDISGTVSKGAPDFCTVYVIGNGKIQSMRPASSSVPKISPLQAN
ncbi:uncharacterized protein [Medicago truncatula]|uniref:uncharacterized protein n=1 Tax=Medicago truncatula TaxID=3880 RepID=UPI000D2F24B9|nr:uncharacterized protein LOC11436092 [Medicago truncatula]